MFQKLLVSVAALSLTAQPALADIPRASPQVLAVIANSCTSESAFDRAIGEPVEGRQRGMFAEAGYPLQSFSVLITPMSGRVTGMEIMAYHDEADGDADARRVAATELFDDLDAAVQEAGLFGGREVNPEDGAVTYFEPTDGGDVELEIYRLGVGVYITCASPALQTLAMDEALGRTRVERPVRPTMDLPPRLAMASCQDPVQRAAVIEGFEGAASIDLLESLQRNQRYAEGLGRWYSQQLRDQGVWDDDSEMAFLMALLEDPVISGGMTGQMERLSQYLELIGDYIDAKEGGDDMGACRSVVSATSIMHDVHASNTAQWDRTYELYRAEARRLGATLEN